MTRVRDALMKALAADRDAMVELTRELVAIDRIVECAQIYALTAADLLSA